MDKKSQLFIVFFSLITIVLFSKCNSEETTGVILKVSVENPQDISRSNEVISINANKLYEKYPDFNSDSFIVLLDDNEVPSQITDFNNDGKPDEVNFLADFQPNETKVFSIKSGKDIKRNTYRKRTQAYLGKKTDYKLVDGYYTEGRFESVDSSAVPEDHFPHNALFQYEGPGWESELVAYRFYLDNRNRTDIFGKKNNELVVSEIGKNDLVSDSKESYTKMNDWGMDIFKVGETFGIGSFAAWENDKPVFVSEVDSIICFINNGPLKSGVFTKYLGWNTGEKKYNLSSDISISAGSRLSEVILESDKNNIDFAAGFAKHSGTEFLKSDNEEWNYIALWGKQTTSEDNLGIALFYNKNDLIKLTEDDISYIVVLKPENNKLKYYFAAAWEQEKNGIKDINKFKEYLNDELEKLNSGIQITLN